MDRRSFLQSAGVTIALTAGIVEKEWRGGPFTAFGYDGRSPGREIRVKEGDTLRVRVIRYPGNGR